MLAVKEHVNILDNHLRVYTNGEDNIVLYHCIVVL